MSLAGPKTRTANPLKRPRQEPVSCQFCRSKKLKCNRQHPCSNCVARGLPCNSSSQPSNNIRSPVDALNESILCRLQRLEDMILGPAQHGLPAANQGSQPSPSLTQSRPTASPMECLSPASEYEEAVQSLERIANPRDPFLSSNLEGPEIRVLATQQICDIYGVAHIRAAHGWQDSRCLFLPPEHEASLLLDHYISHIDALQHVVYIPRVRALMDEVYLQLQQALPVVHSQVALLMSIFATSAALLTGVGGSLQQLFRTSDPYQAARIWANAALELMEFSRRTTAGSLEYVQTSILMGFLSYHMEDFSARSRFLFVGAVAIARDLCLHKLDAPTNRPSDSSNPIETEIKRRVWWHIVATDWLLAHNGGPQEGTYLVHPRHMCVNLPRNVNDTDLYHDNPSIDLPLSEPTIMSYYIQRIKVADICRSVVDVMPLSSPSISKIDYQDVIALDRKFEAFFEDLPWFFKMDDKSRAESDAIMRKYPHMRLQRYTLGTVALIQRCKLHQPFLIRRSAEGYYNYSRDVSLQCARAVISLKGVLDAEVGTMVHAPIQPGSIAYHIFMATIVLVMDICFNRNEGDDAARKAEVTAACKALEDCISRSRAACDFLSSVTETLRKYKVKLHHPPGGMVQEAIVPASMEMFHPSQDVLPISKQQPDNASSMDNTQHVFADFDKIWKEYVEYGPNMDMPDWDSLFNDLDSRLY
ncbi:hypothetical protein A1O1_06177 [Capronia coronata CBS 617.96]|uniref:Zn(2)-C6 fungal-type domain-containing protein n=1 Tax=Capronia coronata CBS 617.96 TaxID=1182541 RepID=W9Y002_9EURO|nr:uncharacterized protein A1O1_06177 [Capronia coronata CBS 617.96]EXJ85808.1 hypothetical protein A1O1_06177 [Capronia coronata CBS 617.96]